MGVDRPAGTPLRPTFQGYISTTMDALILFEACLTGRLTHVPRRPHDRERADLISSGNIFIYEENSSGIKRWTDGMSWSPSRILGNFLLYRELDKPFQPGEKKRALKRPKSDAGGVSKPSSSRSSSVSGYGGALVSGGGASMTYNGLNGARNDAERSLVGSLVDSYQFKTDGLVKKTISVTHNGIQHHLVSYYTIKDVIAGKLSSPARSEQLSDVTPRPTLLSCANFRAPVDDHELAVHGHNPGWFTPNYSMNGSNPRSLSVPSIHTAHTGYAQQPQYGAYAAYYGQPYSSNQSSYLAQTQAIPQLTYPSSSHTSYQTSPQVAYSSSSHATHATYPSSSAQVAYPGSSSRVTYPSSSSIMYPSSTSSTNVTYPSSSAHVAFPSSSSASTFVDTSYDTSAFNYDSLAVDATDSFDQKPTDQAFSYDQRPTEPTLKKDQKPSDSDTFVYDQNGNFSGNEAFSGHNDNYTC